MNILLGAAISGLAAGTVNGVFGGAGGMLLIPLLQKLTDLERDAVFPTSVSVILPICIVSLTLSTTPLPWREGLPYLLGSILGGILVGVAGRRIPVKWLHRIFGAMILWGGIRYLW